MKLNKTIIITGGTGFIGSHLCQQFINNGHKVICISRKKEDAISLRKRLSNITPENFSFYIFDINNEVEVEKYTKKIKKDHKVVDALVNNAAKRCEESDFDIINKKNWTDVFEVNVISPFILSRAIADFMPKYGSIINIGSIYGVTSTDMSIYRKDEKVFGYNMVYGVSKAALIHLTKYLATKYGGRQIRVNTVSFGGVRNNSNKDFIKRYSDKVPMNRMAELDDLHGIILFLISDESRYITGENILIDGGWNLY